MRKRTHVVKPYVRPPQDDDDDVTAFGSTRQRKCWETFFYEQKSPILRSQMLTILMAGSTLETARIPIPALLDAVLVAYVARNYCGAEVVDDYAAFIVFQGESSLSCAEDQYIPAMVQWYLGHDAPIYFDREMTEQEMERHWGLVGKSPPPKRLTPAEHLKQAKRNRKAIMRSRLL